MGALFSRSAGFGHAGGPLQVGNSHAKTRDKAILAEAGNPSYHLHMMDWNQCVAVERVPGKVSGAWLFKGTRVPVAALFENLDDGATVENFLEWFPGVTREQVGAVLEFAEHSLAVG